MSIRYLQSGKLSTIQRIHLNTVSPSSVATEFAALSLILGLFYDDTWKIQLTALTQRVGGTLVRVPTPIDPGTGDFYEETGTSGATPAGAEGYIQQIFTFDTVNNNKARVRLVGVTGGVILPDDEIDADAAGTPAQKLAEYLTVTTTHIVAHDGSKMELPCHLTTALVSNIRRESMRVA